MSRLSRISGFLVACGLLLACSLGPASARAQAVTEYDLKAAFLYNFALFVDWPADAPPDTAFNLCILGKDPFGSALDGLEGREMKARRLAVKRLTSTRGAAECQILFLPASEEAHLTEALNALKGKPVLTVADSEGWLERGVIINMVQRQTRISFDINLDAARQNGLRVSSRLARLAGSVIGK